MIILGWRLGYHHVRKHPYCLEKHHLDLKPWWFPSSESHFPVAENLRFHFKLQGYTTCMLGFARRCSFSIWTFFAEMLKTLVSSGRVLKTARMDAFDSTASNSDARKCWMEVLQHNATLRGPFPYHTMPGIYTYLDGWFFPGTCR